MDSRDRDNTTPHQPLLSSLVVRPTDSGGGGGGSDYEPGEVRRGDPPPYLRSDRHDGHGYRMRAGSVSPVRRRDDRRFSPGFEHSVGGPRTRGFGRGSNPPRRRDYSPPHGRGRFAGKGYDRSGHGAGPLRVEGLPRNNPNVQPREGDWYCSDPSCKNLNFARRENCNNCNRPRNAPVMSPRRGYSGPRFPPRRFPSPPLDRSPRKTVNGRFRSPPRVWSRDAPRDLRAAEPPLRRNDRFPSPPTLGGRRDYPEDDSRDRFRHNRPMPPDWGHGDRGRDYNSNSRRGYGRRMLSPPPAPELPPSRGWAPPVRVRSRSPIRGGAPPKDYPPRDIYIDRGQGERRGGGREAF